MFNKNSKITVNSIEVTVTKVTDKAVELSANNRSAWFPKAALQGIGNKFTVANWLSMDSDKRAVLTNSKLVTPVTPTFVQKPSSVTPSAPFSPFKKPSISSVSKEQRDFQFAQKIHFASEQLSSDIRSLSKELCTHKSDLAAQIAEALKPATKPTAKPAYRPARRMSEAELDHLEDTMQVVNLGANGLVWNR